MSSMQVRQSDIRAAKAFYVGEWVGGLLYKGYAGGVDNTDVAHHIRRMGREEHSHSRWYEAWLEERGHRAPDLVRTEQYVVPALNRLFAPRSLEAQLKGFAMGESAAANHLGALAARIHDPELRSIVEKTIPFEAAHAEWFREQGPRMLRPVDRKARWR